jgi:hypothetical protein
LTFLTTASLTALFLQFSNVCQGPRKGPSLRSGERPNIPAVVAWPEHSEVIVSEIELGELTEKDLGSWAEVLEDQ